MPFSDKTKLGRQTMSDASISLREYAATRWPTLNHKGRMARLAGLLNWRYRRMQSIYKAEPTARLRADELAEIDALTTQEAKDDIAELRARLARIESMLAVQDEAFHGPAIDAVREHLRDRR